MTPRVNAGRRRLWRHWNRITFTMTHTPIWVSHGDFILWTNNSITSSLFSFTVMSKKVPKFQETLDSRDVGRKKKTRSAEYYKQRFRKTFAQLVEEDLNVNPNAPNYACAQVPQSRFPDRHFCAVCGFPSNYTCIPCGARYCCVKCLGTHLDTRCLKWTA